MNEEDVKFMEEHKDADFIGVVQVGNRGVRRYFTDRNKYNAFRDKAWDSGFDMYSRVLKDMKK